MQIDTAIIIVLLNVELLGFDLLRTIVHRMLLTCNIIKKIGMKKLYIIKVGTTFFAIAKMFGDFDRCWKGNGKCVNFVITDRVTKTVYFKS